MFLRVLLPVHRPGLSWTWAAKWLLLLLLLLLPLNFVL